MKFPEYKTVLVSSLIPYARNSRTHSDEQVAKIAASIKEFSFLNPVIVDGENGIIAGHGRVMAAQKLGMETVPVIEASHLTEAQRRAYIIADNRLALDAGWDDEMLRVEFAELEELGFDLELTGFGVDEIGALALDDQGDEPPTDGEPAEHKGSLADRFGIPPFSVLNAREGWWQNRKRGWLALGIKSELGRGGQMIQNGGAKQHVQGVLMTSDSGNDPAYYFKKQAAEKKAGRELTTEEFQRDWYQGPDTYASGTSIFDPVLCEIAYRWFSPVGGIVLDPFAGGSVRGIVASHLDRQYVGCELRQEQVDANRDQQAIAIDPIPVWHCTDSRRIDTVCADVDADFVFSCPPYADLEVYSDDPKDLSTLGYEEFREAYFDIIAKACARLKEDRFACFVVGDVRDKHGNYYNFVGDTVEAFRQAGLHYYNEAVLITSVGSLPIRAGRQFAAGRKLGKTHQNILVFVKGDGKKAAKACGECEFGDLGAVDADDQSQ